MPCVVRLRQCRFARLRRPPGSLRYPRLLSRSSSFCSSPFRLNSGGVTATITAVVSALSLDYR